MITIDCPFCAGDATTDAELRAMTCDGCGVSVEVAADQPIALDAAA